MSAWFKPFAGLAALGAIVLASAACGDDGGASEEQLASLEQEVQETHEGLTRQSVLYAYTALNAEGLHDIADDIQRASEIDTDYLPQVRRMQIIISNVHWPEELAALAEAATTQLEEFAGALEDDDLAASKKEAPEAHLAWHDLDGACAKYLGGDGANHH